MRAVLSLARRTSYADYLGAEQSSDRRHEFIDGVIVAMAGGSDEHDAIAARFVGAFGSRLPRGCRAFTPDQRFWIPATSRGRYGDCSIICGKPEHPAHDGRATTNPLVVLEVLSPSSEGDDEGDKRRDFQSLSSLWAYVLAAQDARCVKIYRRGSDGAWSEPPDVYRSGDRFDVPGLTRAIEVDEIYDDILDREGRSMLR